MSTRRPKKAVKMTDIAKTLHKALAKRSKADLIDALLDLAKEDRKVFRQLDARFELKSSSEELAAATRQAIADATDFDERDANRNFSYDYAAYEGVKRNLSRLIDLGELRDLGVLLPIRLEHRTGLCADEARIGVVPAPLGGRVWISLESLTPKQVARPKARVLSVKTRPLSRLANDPPRPSGGRVRARPHGRREWNR